MDSKKPIYKSIPFWIVVLFLLYSALGFFTVPYLIKKEITTLAKKQLNSTVSIDKVSFNPFTIASDIEGITLTDKDTTKWFSANKIHTNINLIDTLLHNTRLDEVVIENPYYHLITENMKGKTQLKYPKITPSEAKQDGELLLDIDTIGISQGSIDYNDNTGKKKLNLNLKEILFKNQKFTTKDQDTVFDLTFITDKNEASKIQGTFNFVKQSFSINWDLKNWQTATIFNFITQENNELLGFKNKTGSVNANGKITHSGNAYETPAIVVDALSLNNFATEDEANIQPKIAAKSITADNINVDLAKKSISITSISSNDSDIVLYFDENQQLQIRSQNNKQDEDEKNPSNENNWQYSIEKINANNSLVHLNTTTENKLNFSSIKIDNLSSSEQAAGLDFSLVIDDSGQLNLAGTFSHTPTIELKADINSKDIDLSKWNAWLPKNLNLTTETGLLSLHQTLALKDNEVNSSGWIKLNQLKLLDDNKQTFLEVKQLDLTQSNLNTATKTIKLNQIKIDQASGSLIVSNDKQLNIKNLTTQGNNPEENAEKTDDWIIEINEIELIDSKTSFNDKSIKPNYHTELSKINGKIKGLSSANLSKADVKIKAVLDTYGKIDISGKINPLSEKAYTDLAIDVKNLSLQNFNTYSARYLGFPITRGKADFKLKYKLNQSLLKGVNDLRFKQLKFGAKNNSKDAVGLPLKLAVSLLTDGKGIMKINLPVSGNINDPDFSYGGIVFKAFFKLITGIVASPFKLLGKLIPGGADLDLSGVQFKAGTSELNEGEDAKLQAMKKIIDKRPDIILELTGIANTVDDKKALQKSLLLELLKLDTPPDFEDEASLNTIKQHYVSILTADKWQQLESNATKEGIVNTTQLAENGWQQLLQLQNVDEELKFLAKNRAQLIQKQLIENYSIPEDKVFLKPGEQSDELYPQVKFGVGQ